MATKTNTSCPNKTTLTAHLCVDNAAAAIDFYTKVLGAFECMRMPMPDGKKIMHAHLNIGDSSIMLADTFPEMGGPPNAKQLGGSPVVINVTVDNCDATYNAAIAAGATGTMPPADMFWGDRYAKFTDPFGHSWSLAQPIKELTPEEMMEAASKAFG